MKAICVALIISCFLMVSTSLCWADEKKDHICFRALDSNKDGLVTFKEFEKYYGNDKVKFNQADVDKDGNLTHNEYHSLLGHGSS